jgi:hypothetical protein
MINELFKIAVPNGVQHHLWVPKNVKFICPAHQSQRFAIQKVECMR